MAGGARKSNLCMLYGVWMRWCGQEGDTFSGGGEGVPWGRHSRVVACEGVCVVVVVVVGGGGGRGQVPRATADMNAHHTIQPVCTPSIVSYRIHNRSACAST